MIEENDISWKVGDSEASKIKTPEQKLWLDPHQDVCEFCYRWRVVVNVVAEGEHCGYEATVCRSCFDKQLMIPEQFRKEKREVA